MPRRRKVVLVADDDPHMARLMERTLEPEGYELLRTSDGGEAGMLMAAERPDVAVVDTSMDLDLAGFPDVSIISVTNEAFGGGENRLVKPFSPVELADSVREALRRRCDKG